MKKSLKLFAILAVLLFAASCQNNGLDGNQSLQPTLKVTATIVTPDATRVSYDVDNASTHTITPAWTVGDKIIGFDDDDHTFTFTVSSVDGAGRAVLDLGGYAQGSATKLYAIYAPGKTESNFSGTGEATTLAVDLSTQDGAALNDNSPVLMCATAEITAGSATLTFENQTAIIGVTRFKLPAAATVTSVSVDGLITTGTFSVDGGTLILTPGTTPATVSAAGSWATGADNVCETPLYFATLPTASAKIALRASDGANDYGNLASIAAADIVAGNYYYMQKILGAPVADVNGVKYGTIDDAFAAANRADSDVTITVLDNCTAADRLLLSGDGTAEVTLNVGTYTVTFAEEDSILVNGTRSLTITGTTGKIVSDGTVLRAAGSSTVTINGGTLQSTAARAAYCTSDATLNIEGNASLEGATVGAWSVGTANVRGSATVTGGTSYGFYVNGGTTTVSENAVITGSASGTYGCYVQRTADNNAPILNMTGGTIRALAPVNGNNTRNAIRVGEHGTANISGGILSAVATALYIADSGSVNISGPVLVSATDGSYMLINCNTASQSTVTITDGRFTAPGINPVGGNGNKYVTGGCFNRPVINTASQSSGSVPYYNTLNTDVETKDAYPYVLVSSTADGVSLAATATRGSAVYNHASVESAVQHVTVDATASNTELAIVLQRDVTSSAALTMTGASKAASLDLNNHTWTSSASPVLTSNVNSFTLLDSGSSGEIFTSGATALSVASGTLTVNGGSLVADSQAVSVAGGILNVNDGFFYGNATADIVNAAGTVNLAGGAYRNNPAAELLADGCGSSAESTSHNGRDYDYKVITTSAVATVNGEGYSNWESAVLAATSYSGGELNVTLQLLDNITDATAADFTQANSKPVILDLNGHSITTSVAQFIRTSGTLTITDESISGGGYIESSQPQVIYIVSASRGTINIKKCLIKHTYKADGTGGANVTGSEVIRVMYGTLNLSENAQVWASNATASHAIYSSTSATLTVNNAEITASKGYCIYCGNGSGDAYITISGNETSFYSGGNLMIYCSAASHISISDGYFYRSATTTQFPFSTTNAANYSLTGGYYSGLPDAGNTFSTNLGDGYQFSNVSASHNHRTNSIGTLNYAKAVTVTAE